MTLTTLHKTIFLALTALMLAGCGAETDPKVAFDNGDYETAHKLWLPLAKNGDAVAQNYMGILYYLGFGVTRDYLKAVEWYEKAATAGNSDAQKNYGDMLLFARGTKKNIYEAYKWYFAAFQQGNEGAGKQIEVIAASGNLSPNQQMHAKIDANPFIMDDSKKFMSHDTYINKN